VAFEEITMINGILKAVFLFLAGAAFMTAIALPALMNSSKRLDALEVEITEYTQPYTTGYNNGYNNGYIQGIKDYPQYLSNYADTLTAKAFCNE
jgi:hypothetical protein